MIEVWQVAKVNIEGVGTWPRRQSIPHLTPEEIQISQCIDAVEKLGASVDLTSCVVNLIKAKEHLSNHIDLQLIEGKSS